MQYMTNYTLKPCPFCGAEPKYGTELNSSYGSKVYLSAIIRCPKCKIYKSVQFEAADDFDLIPFEDFATNFDMVINAWNKRIES